MSIALSSHVPVLVLAAATVIAVSGCGADVSFGDDVAERTEGESVSSDGLSSIEVRTTNGAVRIGAGNVDVVDVTAFIEEGSDSTAAYIVTEDGDRLLVEGTCDSRWWSRCKVGFEIVVPPGFDVDIETDNGRIDIDRIDGDVRAASDNGAIAAERLTADFVVAHSDNGRVDLAFDDAPRDVTAVTDNGAIDIEVAVADEGYDVDATSDNGTIGIDVRSDPRAANRIVAETDNGAIDVGYGPNR